MWIELSDCNSINFNDNVFCLHVAEFADSCYGLVADYFNEKSITLAVYNNYDSAKKAYFQVISSLENSEFIRLLSENRVLFSDELSITEDPSILPKGEFELQLETIAKSNLSQNLLDFYKFDLKLFRDQPFKVQFIWMFCKSKSLSLPIFESSASNSVISHFLLCFNTWSNCSFYTGFNGVSIDKLDDGFDVESLVKSFSNDVW